MNLYIPKDNPLVPYCFPEISKILKDNIPIPSWDTRYEILNNFRLECRQWLQSGIKTKISGLERFKNSYLIFGASQYISDLPKIEKRSIALHKNEYNAYKKILDIYDRSYRIESKFKNLDNLADDLIIVSYPFSLNGNNDLDILELLHNSKNKITLDSVFLGTNLFPIDINFNLMPNVETFLYSFSKGFGLTYHRIGIMFTDLDIDEYDIYHSYSYHNLYAAQVARQIISKYNIDYFSDKYLEVYNEACRIKKCLTGNCLLVGLDKNDLNDDRKIKITDLFGELIDVTR